MIRLLTLVLLLGAVTPAWATGPVLNHCVFTWTESAAGADLLAGFKLYIGTTSGGPYALAATIPATPITVATNYGPTPNECVGLPDGQKFAVITAFDSAGNESAKSLEVPFALRVTAPGAPTNLGVQ